MFDSQPTKGDTREKPRIPPEVWMIVSVSSFLEQHQFLQADIRPVPVCLMQATDQLHSADVLFQTVLLLFIQCITLCMKLTKWLARWTWFCHYCASWAIPANWGYVTVILRPILRGTVGLFGTLPHYPIDPPKFVFNVTLFLKFSLFICFYFLSFWIFKLWIVWFHHYKRSLLWPLQNVSMQVALRELNLDLLMQGGLTVTG